jgi:hypothetical protein
LVFLAVDEGDVHVVGGGRKIFKLLAGEDVESDKVDLGVTVLASLGGGHVNDLARAALDDNMTVLAQSRALLGEGGGGTRIAGRRVCEILYMKRYIVSGKKEYCTKIDNLRYAVHAKLIPRGSRCGAGMPQSAGTTTKGMGTREDRTYSVSHGEGLVVVNEPKRRI